MPATNARPIDVAIAAVALLNLPASQATFAAPFTAARGYEVPLYDLQKKDTLGIVVTVIPDELNESPLTRHEVQSEVSVHVGIQNFVQSLTDKDAMMLLVEQVKTVMEQGLTLPEAAVDCGWLGTENSPLWDPAHLEQYSVFTSVPRFRYLTRRPR